MTEVRERYLKYNSHAKSYTFKTMNEQSGTWIWKDLIMDKVKYQKGYTLVSGVLRYTFHCCEGGILFRRTDIGRKWHREPGCRLCQV